MRQRDSLLEDFLRRHPAPLVPLEVEADVAHWPAIPPFTDVCNPSNDLYLQAGCRLRRVATSTDQLCFPLIRASSKASDDVDPIYGTFPCPVGIPQLSSLRCRLIFTLPTGGMETVARSYGCPQNQSTNLPSR